jgi:hypothetical protein
LQRSLPVILIAWVRTPAMFGRAVWNEMPESQLFFGIPGDSFQTTGNRDENGG